MHSVMTYGFDSKTNCGSSLYVFSPHTHAHTTGNCVRWQIHRLTAVTTYNISMYQDGIMYTLNLPNFNLTVML